MEIERKFTVRRMPDSLESYPFHRIEQAYLNTDPVIRIRRQDDDYYLTYKGSGMLAREEYNLPINRQSYLHLLKKADGNLISKKRYLIPIKHPQFAGDAAAVQKSGSLTIELDVFDPPFAPLVIAEVEFDSTSAAESFLPPEWFQEDVTYDPAYHNSALSRRVF